MDKGVINKTFSVILFVYLLYINSALFLFKPHPIRDTPWNRLYDWSPTFALVLAVLVVVVVVLWGAALLRAFWNRWIVDVFKVREITYDEAIALILILAIGTG
jgi:hypothetical protein